MSLEKIETRLRLKIAATLILTGCSTPERIIPMATPILPVDSFPKIEVTPTPLPATPTPPPTPTLQVEPTRIIPEVEEKSPTRITLNLWKEESLKTLTLNLFERFPEVVKVEKNFGLSPQSIYIGRDFELYKFGPSGQDAITGIPIRPGRGSVQTLIHAPQRNTWRFSEAPKVGPLCYFAAPIGKIRMIVGETSPYHGGIVFDGEKINQRFKALYGFKEDWFKEIKLPYWLDEPYYGHILFIAETHDGKRVYRLGPIIPKFFPSDTHEVPGEPERGKQCNERMMKLIRQNAFGLFPEDLGVLVGDPIIER